MASYKIEWKRSAAKELKRVPPEIIKRILVAIEALAEAPFPAGVKKLVGSHHTYRIREGSYRVIYSVNSDVVMIEIIKIGHRKSVYRQHR
jgi:mRNA interferase RelE/StbE